MNLVKERVYPIRRADGEYWVDPDTSKIIKKVSGGATAATPNSQANAAAAALNSFLGIAPKKFYTIIGTIPTGSAGGSTANVSWQQQIPIIPAFCTAVDYNITLPVTVNFAAGGTAMLSPYAPYSAFANQITLGGAPPWPLTELTPWYLDQTEHKINYDPDYPGLGNAAAPFGNVGATYPALNASLPGISDQGPTPNAIGGAGSIFPGVVVTGAAPANYTWTFKLRMQLQRKRHLLWGAIPFGDPENRPNNITQLYPLAGTLPEQSLFINTANLTASGIQTNGTVTVKATYELAYIDLLPPNMQSAPNPAVGFGLQLVTSSPTGMAAGALFPITHRTAMIYTAIHHLLINGQQPLRADYFGLWDDQDQQSARWSFDASANTLMEYFDQYQRRYRRYPLVGQYSVPMDDGEFPEVPSVTPYDALMSPDQSYANTFGVPVTPAMTTALRIPSGTVLSSPYIRNYEYGLVRVPY